LLVPSCGVLVFGAGNGIGAEMGDEKRATRNVCNSKRDKKHLTEKGKVI
jgi:hypothetical protein